MSNSNPIQAQPLPNPSELSAMNIRINELHEKSSLLIRWIGKKFGSEPDFPSVIIKRYGIKIQDQDVVEPEKADELSMDIGSGVEADLELESEIEIPETTFSNVLCPNRQPISKYAGADQSVVKKVKSLKSSTKVSKSKYKKKKLGKKKTNVSVESQFLAKQQQLQQETELIKPCSVKLTNILIYRNHDPEISNIIQNLVPEPVVPSSSNTNPVPKRQILKCPSCPKTFSEKHRLDSHIRVHTGEKEYVCEYCGKEFIQSYSLTLHRQVHTGEKPFSCDLCGLSFSQPKHVRAHKAKEHPGTKPFICKYCYQGLGSLQEMKAHSQSHLNTDNPYTCNFCGKGFKEANPRNKHRRIHISKYLLKCEVCGKQFTFPVRYRIHLATHLPPEKRESPKHNCDICGKPCNYNNLIKHRLTHVSLWETSFECKVCSKRFNSEKRLKVHSQVHTGNRPYPCKICGQRFQYPQYRRNHEKAHQGEFQCKICGRNIGSAYYLKMHTLKYHGPTKSENVCENCGKHFSRGTLKNHKEKHSICSKYYQQKERSTSDPNSISSGYSPGSVADLYSEIESAFTAETTHNNYEEQIAEENVVAIKSFNKATSFKSKRKKRSSESKGTNALKILAKYQKFQQDPNPTTDPEIILNISEQLVPELPEVSSSATTANPAPEKRHDHECPLCSKIFKAKRNLEWHVMLHTGEKPHECEVCRKKFVQNSTLIRHQRVHVHTRKKPFSCDVCGLSFSQPTDIRAHKAKEHSNTRTKPYTCKLCYQGFSSLEEMKTHSQTHLNADNFWTCDFCVNIFDTKRDLELHIMRHTGEKPYACKICGKKFIQNPSLTRHQRVHTRQKSFSSSCDLCGLYFSQPTDIEAHKAKEHPGTNQLHHHTLSNHDKKIEETVNSESSNSRPPLEEFIILDPFPEKIELDSD